MSSHNEEAKVHYQAITTITAQLQELKLERDHIMAQINILGGNFRLIVSVINEGTELIRQHEVDLERLGEVEVDLREESSEDEE